MREMNWQTIKSEELYKLMESWENLVLLVKEIGDHPEYFELLMEIALNSKDNTSWRAAWMADKIHDRFPELIKPYIIPMILTLENLTDQGKKRHFLKLISINEIPEKYAGFLAGYCIEAFCSAEPPAIRVHAMQVLYNISEKESEFKPELIQIIEQEMELRPTPGIISRGSKLLRKLRQQVNRRVNSPKGY